MKKKEDIFYDMMSEYFFLFQLETGCSILVKNSLPSTRNTRKSFEFDVLSSSNKAIATYVAEPFEGKLTLKRELGIEPSVKNEIERSFEKFLKKVELKTLFSN